MGPETGVFNGNKGIDQIFRKFFVSGLLTVGAAGNKSFCQISICIINRSSKTVRLDVHNIHRRGIINNTLDHSETNCSTCNCQEKEQDKKCLENIKNKIGCVLSGLR